MSGIYSSVSRSTPKKNSARARRGCKRRNLICCRRAREGRAGENVATCLSGLRRAAAFEKGAWPPLQSRLKPRQRGRFGEAVFRLKTPAFRRSQGGLGCSRKPCRPAPFQLISVSDWKRASGKATGQYRLLQAGG